MMKKLLILMLVLGLASSANALVVTLSPSGSGPHAAGDVTIDVISDSDDIAYEYFLSIADLTYGDISGIAILTNAGSDATTTDYGDVLGAGTHTIAIGASDSTDPFDIAAGTQFTATIAFTGAAVGQNLTVALLDNTTAQIDSYTIQGIPEPMTIALLGLGGLFLLRRRK